MQRVKVQLEWHLCPKNTRVHTKTVIGNVISQCFCFSAIKKKWKNERSWGNWAVARRKGKLWNRKLYNLSKHTYSQRRRKKMWNWVPGDRERRAAPLWNQYSQDHPSRGLMYTAFDRRGNWQCILIKSTLNRHMPNTRIFIFVSPFSYIQCESETPSLWHRAGLQGKIASTTWWNSQWCHWERVWPSGFTVLPLNPAVSWGSLLPQDCRDSQLSHVQDFLS